MFAFSGSGNCDDRNVTVLVGIDESWYDCSGTSAVWLWVHVAASNKVGCCWFGRWA